MITPDQLRNAAIRAGIVPFLTASLSWPELTPEQRQQWDEMARLVNTHFSIVASFRNQPR